MIPTENMKNPFYNGAKVMINNTHCGTIVQHSEENRNFWKIVLNDGTILFEDENQLKPLDVWYHEQNEGGEGKLNFSYLKLTTL